MANGKKQKMTAKQLKEREERALERQRLAEEKEARRASQAHIRYCGVRDFDLGPLSSHHGPYVPWRKPIKAPSGKTTKRCPSLCGLVALKR